MGRASLILTTLLLMALSSGCAHSERDRPVAVLAATSDLATAPRSSLVFDPATLRTAREDLGPIRPPGVEPWYADRRDRPDAVAAGFQSPVVQRVITRTYDQRGSTFGFAYDDTYTRTYREEIQEGVR